MHHRSDHRGRRSGRTPSRRLQFLGRRLELTDEQMDELSLRLGRHRAKGRELFRAHRAERMSIIRDVLDDEQRERFEAMLRRRGERRGRRGLHHRGHEPGETSPSEDDIRV
ncbi:MAG: hypothetical protein AAGA17_01940 [Actinomycetota bacterium]